MASNYKIGTTVGGITSLDLLSTPVVDPKSSFIDYSVRENLGDGSQRGGGWKVAEWHWDFLRRSQRDKLKSFCSGASATVFIRTRCNDSSDGFKTYQAIMIWPEEETKDAGRRMDFTIQFRALVEQV